MRKKIKIFFILAITLSFVNFILKYQNPNLLAISFERYLNKTKYRIAFFLRDRKKFNNNLTLNKSLYKKVIPIVKKSYAKQKINIYYKGKKLTIISEVDNPSFSEKELEFFYQIELLRGKKKEKN